MLLVTVLNTMKIKLYHGTCECNLKKLVSSNNAKLYLTLDDEQAIYYAQCCAEEKSSPAKIITVEVETDYLFADLPSFNEPLSYILNYHGMTEDEWHAAIENGDIPYPSIEDWKSSIKYTKTALYKGPISSNMLNISQNACLILDDLHRIQCAIIHKKTNSKP